MKVLHLLSVATIGGIEVLCRDIAEHDPKQNIFAILFKTGPMEKQLEDTGAHCYSLYKLKKWNITGCSNKLYEICVSEKIDIVVIHHEGLSVLVYYMLLQKHFPSIKFVRYLHSVFEEKYYYTYGPLLNFFAKKMMTSMYRKSDKLVAVSQCVKNSFTQNFPIPPDKVQVIYNGISAETLKENKESYRSRKTVKRHDECVNVIYMGRLEKVKGIDVLIEAFSMLFKESINMKLYLLGDGNAREELEALVQKRGIEKFVSFEGFQLQKKKYLQEADVFVYPSRWQEAFGISIIEAMSCGIICIASAVGGIPEIICDGENGLLFKNEDVMDLKKKLADAGEIIRDGKQDRIANQALKTAADFSLENTIHTLNDLFDDLCK